MSLDIRLKNINHCDKCGRQDYSESFNITHNLGKMAEEAGIYYALWRPEEKGYVYAKDIIPFLEKGLADLKSRPKHFEKFNATNGWGTYEYFVPFVQQVLEEYNKYPDGTLYVDR